MDEKPGVRKTRWAQPVVLNHRSVVLPSSTNPGQNPQRVRAEGGWQRNAGAKGHGSISPVLLQLLCSRGFCSTAGQAEGTARAEIAACRRRAARGLAGREAAGCGLLGGERRSDARAPAWQRSPTALSQQRCGSDSCGWRGDASLCICNRGFAGSACSGFHGERLVVGEGAGWQTVQSWKYRYSVCFPRCMNKIINS